MRLPARTETVIIGAGHAGLSMSRLLRDAGRDHIVLERRSTLGGGWQDRWDEFCLVTPNWTASFPGHSYDGADPDGFMPRDEIAARVRDYARVIDAPVVLEAGVSRLSHRPAGGFRIETPHGVVEADEVVVAAGSFHVPSIPPVGSEMPTRLTQVHSHEYRNERSLPPGAALVVGSGQSGVQIAEELAWAGRRVFLSVGKAGRVPRRYRGRDIVRWLADLALRGPAIGTPLPTVDMLPDPRARLAGNPQLSGHRGGHETDLRRFAADGMTLLGRIDRVVGERLDLAPDLSANLAAADRSFDERFGSLIDRYITVAGIDAPADDRRAFDFDPPDLRSLDLADAGISTVVWATGYRQDYAWVDLPIVDELGFPRQRRGITEVPGLYFLGLLWQHTQLSATLLGPMLDAPPLLVAMGLPAPTPDTVEV